MNIEGQTILVTGGAGAIGCNLVRELARHDCKKIIVLDNLDSGHARFLPTTEKVKFIKGSITDEKLLDRIFTKKIDIVFHLAANFANQNSVDNPLKDLLTNGNGTLQLLVHSQRKKVRRFIYTSSSCVYGHMTNQTSKLKTEAKLDTPYAITKLLGEYYVNFYHEYYKMPTIILRLFNSFGPGELPGKYRNVVPNFFAKAMRRESLIITGTGNETRDFNYVDNVIQALLLSVKNDEATGMTFNVGSGVETKIIDIAKKINSITKNNAPIIFKERRTWDNVRRRVADISATKAVLGYDPIIGSLDSQLKKTYEWVKNVSTHGDYS